MKGMTMRARDKAGRPIAKDIVRDRDQPALLKPRPPGVAVEETCVAAPIVDPITEPSLPKEARRISKPTNLDDSSAQRSARSA
jgi:hypothetical protein